MSKNISATTYLNSGNEELGSVGVGSSICHRKVPVIEKGKCFVTVNDMQSIHLNWNG